MNNYKSKIEYNLNILIRKYSNLKDRFKVNAYKKALNHLPDMISTINDVKDVGGKKTYDKLKFIIETNNDLQEVKDYISDDSFKVLEEFQKIYGIGPAKAQELYEKHNMRSIENLKENTNLLNDKQKIGLLYYDDISQRIPFNEMCKHDDFISKIMKDLYEDCEMKETNIRYVIVGSYRRKVNDSGDIDILLSGDKNYLNRFIELLIKKKYIIKDAILANGDVKFMGMCKLPRYKRYRRLDILYTPPSEYPFAQLYFTGSYQFNIRMRTHALKLGYSLNEQSLIDVNTKKPVIHNFETEKDIFEFLDFEYLSPEERLN